MNAGGHRDSASESRRFWRRGPAGAAGLALLCTVPVPSVAVLASMLWFPGTVLGSGVYVLNKAVQAVVPWAWWRGGPGRAVERGSVGEPARGLLPRGLGLRAVPWSGWAWGVGLGVAIGVVIVAGYAWVGRDLVDPEPFREQAARNGLDAAVRYWAFAAGISLGNALLEEVFWRWFVLGRCVDLIRGRGGSKGKPSRPTWAWAIGLAAVLFTVHHVIALGAQFGVLATALASLGVLIGGVVWSLLTIRFESIWPAYVSHVLANAAMFAVGWWILAG